MIGTTISHYHVLEKLGAGGMGVVYKAQDTRLGRFVALKFLPEEFADDSQLRERFQREARAASALNHPNICTIYDIGEENGRLLIAMEFLDGATLKELVKNRPLEMDRLIELAVQVVDGLDAAHSEGILHRDIKPANIFVTRKNHVKILDFGLAKIAQQKSSKVLTGEDETLAELEASTTGGAALGTIAYMSPEQALGKPLDARTDLFSLGVTLYQMATGPTPFHGDTSAVVLLSLIQETPVAPVRLNPDVPQDLERIIAKCLEKDRNLRYQHASDIRPDLQRLKRDTDSRTRNLQTAGVQGAAAMGAPTVLPSGPMRQGSEQDGAQSPAGSTIEAQPTPLPEQMPLAAGSAFGRFARKRVWTALGVAALAVLSAFVIWRTLRKPSEPPLSSLEVVPLLAMPGKQSSPAFSPDGNQVAFAEHDENRGGIYITLVGGEKPLQLTVNPGDCCPAWSPDGRQIAFVRTSESGKERSFQVIAALGGSERKLYTGPIEQRYDCNRLDWSPDGKDLAFSETVENGSRSRITLLSLSDLTRRQLSSPQSQEFDCQPAFSPDGLQLAFIRKSLGTLGDLFVLPVSSGYPLQLTSGNSAAFPAWTPDGGEIVFTSVMGGLWSLWRIPDSGGTPHPVAGVGELAFSPSISRKGNQLVYQHILRSDNVWRIELKADKRVPVPPVRLLSARGFVRRPDFSPDGKKVVFESDRLGYSDIWECDSDGSNCQQLTSIHGTSGTARWSPDGAHVAFESISQGYYNVYVIDLPGGRPRLLQTFPGTDNGAPNWSRDGQWIYFYSARQSESYQLWKVPFSGGSPVQVTKNGGVYAIESDDRQFLYFSKYGQPGVWKMPLDGGDETRVLDLPLTWYSWALTSRGIYFLNSTVKANARIEFFDFATHQTTAVLSLEKPASDFGGLAVSPDHKTLLYGQTELDESYLMLVKNFR